MKRIILAVALAAVAFPSAAVARQVTPRHAGVYEHLYHHAAAKYGKRAPGRNVLKDGRSDSKPVTDARVLGSIKVLERLLYPPPVVVSQPVVTSTAAPSQSVGTSTAPAPSYSSGGAGGVPACASESGTNYSTGGANTNASSGATGRYQILPSTARAYGCSMATPSAQDACAQTIYQHQGASAWVGCGG